MTLRRLIRPLMYLGIVATVLALSKVHARYIADPPYSFTGSFRFAWAIAYIGLLGVASYGLGLPDLPRTLRSAALNAVAATSLAAIGISAVQLVGGDALLPRFVVFGTVLVLVPWSVLCSVVAMSGRTRAEERDQVVVVAAPHEAELLRRELAIDPERPAHVVDVLSVEQAGAGGRPLLEAVSAHHASVVVLNREAQSDQHIVAQAASLHERGVRVRTLSLFYEQWLGKLPLTELERVSLLFDIGELHDSRYSRFKRLLDVGVSALGLVAFVLSVPFVVIGNLLGNRGSLFYTQPRVGKNGEEFEILKFRTMRSVPGAPAGDDEDPGGRPADPDAVTTWTQERDPRITPFGRLLRVSHVDELPQMVNIMRGELSIVGPRPEQPHYVAELAGKLPFYDLRHLVRPGLTGWAQVKYGYAADDADALEKLQYEFFYLRHQRLTLDLRIIGRTIRSVIGRGGR